MLSFNLAEYQERIKRTKEKMQMDGLEVLLVTDPANMNYLSGYDGWSFYVHQMLVLIMEEEEPIWIGRGIDVNVARETTWLSEENIICYPDDHVQNSIKHPMDFVGSVLQDKGQDQRIIGVEMDNYYFTALCYDRLTRALPDVEFKDGNLTVNRVRIIKSEQEIEYMKRAAKISERAMYAAYNAIDAGVRECDAAADIYHAQISGTPEFGGDYPSIVPLMPSGERAVTPHLTWTDQPYQQGDTVSLELSGCHKRYHSPLARTMVIGDPHPKLQNLAEAIQEGIEAALDVVKPGVTCGEVAEAWTKSIEESGYTKEDRIGYSVGLNYPPDWGEHTASIREGDMTFLEPNMTFHMIPGVWTTDFGVCISESFRVTEHGYELLANVPRELYVKE